MCRRCYDKADKSYGRYGAKGVTVCAEWLDYQKFAEFYHSDRFRRDGWHLDKDIIQRGNKEYSPLTCAFVPKEINAFLTLRGSDRGLHPIGVYQFRGKFVAKVCTGKDRVWLGAFDTAKEAHAVYIAAKIAIGRQIALRYDGEVDDRVTSALSQIDENYIEGSVNNVK
jgi:hypothetical protein